MSIIRIRIENFKSIKKCDLSLLDLNLIIGENGTGKSNFLDAFRYFYNNLTENKQQFDIFDENNIFSNEVKIIISFDISKFVKIAKSKIGFSGILLEDEKQDGYYSKILSMSYRTKNKIIDLEMRQIKGEIIKWNYKYSERFIIKSLFPFFCIDARDIKINDWEEMWDYIGDLTKGSNEEKRIILEEIKKIFESNGNGFSTRLKTLEEAFTATEIQLKKLTSHEFAKLITQIYYEGKTFKSNGKELGYFSTGTNAINYIKIFINIVAQITRIKVKEPLLIIDEPELNLHHVLIDDLTNEVENNLAKYKMIIASHSPRLIKNIIKSENKVNVYNVRLINKYSIFSYMHLFDNFDNRVKYKITDEYANAYFSRMMLLVEGETEIELFSNPYLRSLFPQLKSFDIYQSLTDKVIKNIIIPSKTNTSTPYILLIDMDKAIKYGKKHNSFSFGEYLCDLTYKRNQQFLINQKKQKYRTNIYYLRKRIEAMCKKCKFHIASNMYSCKDGNYDDFINAIKEYFLNFSIFVNKTTVEGLLITKESKDFIYEFTKSRKKSTEFQKFESLYSHLTSLDEVNSLRLLYKGKTDLLLNFSDINYPQQEIDKIACNQTEKNVWVTDYWSYYFEKLLSSWGIRCTNISQFKKIIEETQNKSKIINEFKKTYKELSEFIQLCQKMFYDTIYIN